MWRSYYGHKPLALFGELVELLRDQYHVPFRRACAGAYYAAQAAVVFQRGHDRGEYERALPDLKRYYSIVRRGSDAPFDRGSDAPFDRGSDAPFDVEKSAQLELEWWIVHRERDRRKPGGLARALAGLQAEIYHCPQDRLVSHAKARAMLIRDSRAAAGGVTEPDWERIGALLDTSWVSP